MDIETANREAILSPEERDMLLDRRFSDSLWNIWSLFDRRSKEILVKEKM